MSGRTGGSVPAAVRYVRLKLRSVESALTGRARPSATDILTGVFGSAVFRRSSKTMLMAVGLSPDSICDVDSSEPDWRNRIARDAFVVSDVMAARELSWCARLNIVRVIADDSLEELRAMTVASLPQSVPNALAKSITLASR